jgi:hypothetical protein
MAPGVVLFLTSTADLREDDRVRARISVFARLDKHEETNMVRRLKADLRTGDWAKRNTDLLDRAEIDLGYRLVVAELEPKSSTEG